MKKLLSILLAVTFVLSMVTVVSAYTPNDFKYENWQKNGTGTTSASTPGYQFNYVSSNASNDVDTNVAKIVKGVSHGGSYSVYVQHDANGTCEMTFGLYNMMGNMKSGTVENTFWLKDGFTADKMWFGLGGDSNSTGTPYVQINNGVVEPATTSFTGKGSVISSTVTKGATENGWTEYTVTFTAPSTGYMAWHLCAPTGSAISNFFIDDVKVMQGDTNVFASWDSSVSGFERVQAWPVRRAEYLMTVGGGWKEGDFGSGVGIAAAHNFIEVSDDYASEGEKSLHVVWSDRLEKWNEAWGQIMKIDHGTSNFEKDQKYRITVDVKYIVNDNRSIAIGNHGNPIRFDKTGDADTTLDKWEDITASATDLPEGWQRLQITQQHSSDKGNRNLRIQAHNREVDAYLDNIVVEKLVDGAWVVDPDFGDGSFEAVPSAVEAAEFSVENVVAGDITVSKVVPYQVMNITKDAMMSVVLYKDGRVFDIETVDASAYSLAKDVSWEPSVTITVPNDVDAHDYEIKVMVWGRGTGMSPLCGTDTLSEAAAE